MKRGLWALATIGSTAPFVGLFSTMVGILNGFKGIQGTEQTGLSAVAGGVAEALVTTAFGLLVAVPEVWVYNYFTDEFWLRTNWFAPALPRPTAPARRCASCLFPDLGRLSPSVAFWLQLARFGMTRSPRVD